MRTAQFTLQLGGDLHMALRSCQRLGENCVELKQFNLRIKEVDRNIIAS